VAVIVDDGQFFGALVVEGAGRWRSKQEIVVDKIHGNISFGVYVN
jgi:hypothetical protein